MDRRSIKEVAGAPTMYLVDEYHHCDHCTNENVQVAAELYRQGVVLAGVEGYDGGLKYDDYDDKYVESETHPDPRVDCECRPDTLIGSYPKFADALISRGFPVIGVDSRGLGSRIESDCDDGTWDGDAKDHPKQSLRTDHFVRTLFEEVLRRQVIGDVLLNCGADHNSRIEAAIAKEPPPGWPDWNFVRLRCASFDECRHVDQLPAV